MDAETIELLRDAAKAAGHEVVGISGDGLLLAGVQHPWNPVADSGQALDLAALKHIDIEHIDTGRVKATRHDIHGWVQTSRADTAEAMRWAIVRCAAQSIHALA